MIKIFAIAFALVALELFGFKELVSFMHPIALIKFFIAIPFVAIAAITAWYPFAVGICGGPERF